MPLFQMAHVTGLLQGDPLDSWQTIEEGPHGGVRHFVVASVDEKGAGLDLGDLVKHRPCFQIARQRDFGGAPPVVRRVLVWLV